MRLEIPPDTLETVAWSEAISHLPSSVRVQIKRDEPMARHTTLRVGGPADYFLHAVDLDALAAVAIVAQRFGLPFHILGDGSNVCVSDAGIRGFVVRNGCTQAEIGPLTRVDTGHNFMRLFVRTMQAGLSGMEWAVGIPGTVGGALVSNAGAYGGNICDIVEQIEVVEAGERKWVSPDWMEFSYRDSRLRRDDSRPATLLAVTLRFTAAPKRQIRLKAGEIQYQRILKQPWEPSAGSFFKNIHDRTVVERIPGLPELMRQRGVVPTAFLAEACGCKGLTIGGAGVAARHANFIVNRGGATAADIRAVAETVKARVWERFQIALEEEVLYLGAWNTATA